MRRPNSIAWFLSVTILGLLFVCLQGCASAPKPDIHAARHAFLAGDLATATSTLDELIETDRRWRRPARLDRAITLMAAGDVGAAEVELRSLRDELDHAGGGLPVDEAISMLRDDRSREFEAAPHEQVMIRTLLCLCSLAGDASDAESYAIQAAMKQADVRRDAEEQQQRWLGSVLEGTTHQELAFAPYVRGVLKEATHHDYDDASRNYALVSAISPNFASAKIDHQRVTSGTHSRADHGVVYVFALVGRGPQLVPVDAPATTAASTVATALLRTDDTDPQKEKVWAEALAGIQSVKVPRVMVPESRIAGIGISTGAQSISRTEPLTDVATLAINQNEARMPLTIGRAVARRIVKEMAVNRTAKALDIDGQFGSIFRMATSAVWTGTEQADTRNWGLLPREIQVARIELPVGVHTLDFHPIDPAGIPAGSAHRIPVKVLDAENSYLILIAPDQHIFVANAPS